MAHTSFRLLEHGTRNNPNYPLFVYDVSCKAGMNAIHAHWHEEVEILYMGSDGTIEIDTQEISYQSGDILFINKEQLHIATAYTDGNIYVILFPYTFLDFKSSDRCQTEILDPLKTGRLLFPSRLTKNDPAYDEIRLCLLDIIKLYFSRTPGRDIKMKSCLYDILFWCCTKQVFEIPSEPKTAPQTFTLMYVKTAITYMEEHFSSVITMDELADHVGIHKHYLNNIFRQITGVTPIVYLRQLRLEQSIGMLETGASVTQAALASGFNNISYYIREFKKTYGVSPKQYALEMR